MTPHIFVAEAPVAGDRHEREPESDTEKEKYNSWASVFSRPDGPSHAVLHGLYGEASRADGEHACQQEEAVRRPTANEIHEAKKWDQQVKSDGQDGQRGCSLALRCELALLPGADVRRIDVAQRVLPGGEDAGDVVVLLLLLVIVDIVSPKRSLDDGQQVPRGRELMIAACPFRATDDLVAVDIADARHSPVPPGR